LGAPRPGSSLRGLSGSHRGFGVGGNSVSGMPASREIAGHLQRACGVGANRGWPVRRFCRDAALWRGLRVRPRVRGRDRNLVYASRRCRSEHAVAGASCDDRSDVGRPAPREPIRVARVLLRRWRIGDGSVAPSSLTPESLPVSPRDPDDDNSQSRDLGSGEEHSSGAAAHFVAPGPALGLLPSATLTMPTWKIVPLPLTTSDENRPPALRQSMHQATKASGARLGKACRAALCRSARSCPTVPGAVLLVAMPKAPRHNVSALLAAGEPAQPETLSRPTVHNAAARSRARSSARRGNTLGS
jgi:hypothetical protein